MPVETVNGHVLLPHYPDWTRKVQRARVWQTSVDRALTGFEVRAALRPKSRERLTFRVESRDPDDLVRLLARVDAALKAGLGCCPGWGRGIPLTTAGGTEVRLSRPAWDDVQTGSFLFLAKPDGGEAFEVVEVEEVYGDSITLAEALVGAWGAGEWAWPLLFGRPAFSAVEFRTDWHAGVTITLTETATVKTLPPKEPGTITFTFWQDGAPVIDPRHPNALDFTLWFNGTPTLNPD
jgi:hypothetical protein